MNKRNFSFGKKDESIDAHLSDKLLLLAVDGELNAHDANEVRLHLEACWTCRARLEQINESINGVVEYSNLLIREKYPPSEQGQTRFLKSLHQLAERGRRPSQWARLTGLFDFLRGVPRRPAWTAAVAMVCIFALLIRTFRSPAVVSADELVRKSTNAQRQLVTSVPRPVIYQRFEIQITEPSVEPSRWATMDRAIYSDPIANRLVEGRTDIDTEQFGFPSERLKRTFDEAGLDWSNPLSIDSFKRWQDLHPQSAERVDGSDPGLVSIRSTFPSGSVAELRFTFRGSDFHPVAEDIHFRDSSLVRITESFFEVFSMNVIDSNIFALNEGAQPQPVAKPIFPPTPAIHVPNENELQTAEMLVRVALHAVRADLGDQINIQRSDANAVIVQGVLPSEIRKREIESELQGIRDVHTSLAVAGDSLTSGANVDAANSEKDLIEDAPVVVADEPLLKSTLKTKFPDADARKTFVDSTLEAAQSAMAHAWAVRRLRERYSPDAVAQLDPSTRQMLGLLVRDHVAAMWEEIEAESELLKQVLPPHAPEVGVYAASCSGEDWRSSTKAAFTCLEKVQDDTTLLLAGSQNSQNVDCKVQELNDTIQKLREVLPNISRAVSGIYLTGKETTER